MREIMAIRDQRQTELRTHPFMAWLQSPDVPLERKFEIVPALILFVMNFRDLNLWVIRFSDAGDPLRQIINGSTMEDETHSRLFLEDWRKLHMDDRLAWQPGDLLWWMFLAEEMEAFRAYGAEFVRLCVDDGGDPLVRFAHSEAAEACGNVFFSISAPLAEELGRRRGLTYRYFGRFHLDLETGHLLNSESLFQDQPLDEAQYALGVSLLERMFGIFQGIFDSFLSYAKRYVDACEVPVSRACVVYRDRDHDARSVPVTPCASLGPIHPSQRELEDHLLERLALADAHPFYEWLREPGLPAIQKLQRFIPYWALDVLGYRDLNRYFLRYDNPRDELERSVNDVTCRLESHSQLFLQDWKELRLDGLLRWPVSDAMAFFFLDHITDVHRHTSLHFGIEALRHPHPFDRLWFIDILEATGYSFFTRTRELALEAEREERLRLDYLADRHTTVDPAPPERIVKFKSLEIRDPRRTSNVHRLIDVAFDALDRNLTLSLEAAGRNSLAVR